MSRLWVHLTDEVTQERFLLFCPVCKRKLYFEGPVSAIPMEVACESGEHRFLLTLGISVRGNQELTFMER